MAHIRQLADTGSSLPAALPAGRQGRQGRQVLSPLQNQKAVLVQDCLTFYCKFIFSPNHADIFSWFPPLKPVL